MTQPPALPPAPARAVAPAALPWPGGLGRGVGVMIGVGSSLGLLTVLAWGLTGTIVIEVPAFGLGALAVALIARRRILAEGA